ncbi:hypothetical protein ElyMa_004395000 [Elysia marginata]|uniref:Uncharacterized protein n=1 Tax=Elysia marginata TaxID=1093978 RepID=A0AAV4H893_9GAST|nr:hypothetical protein ElyMa_004395000 [Elysia marginata]
MISYGKNNMKRGWDRTSVTVLQAIHCGKIPHNAIRPRGNCATYIDTSDQPTCAADEIVYFDLETCRLTCGSADRLTEDTQSQNMAY